MRDARVEELRGFEVVEGDPDVRGWAVVGRDGRRVGEVKDLLADSEDPAVRYLDVRLEHRPDLRLEAGASGARPTGALDVEKDAIPELDSLAGRDDDEVIGHAAVPGTSTPDKPARTIGESFVRDSLLDVENRMTAGESPDGPADQGGRRVLLRAESVRLEADRRQVRIDSLA
jgi:PRC-barrel domain